MSLIELMVALGIGVFLTIGIVNLFLQSKSSFFQDEETSRLQENGRWALRYVSRELAMSGFYGGVLHSGNITTSLTVSGDCATGWAMNTGTTVEHLNNVTDAQAIAAYSCIATGDVQVGTDIVALRRLKDTPAMSDGTLIAAYAASPYLTANTVYLRNEGYGSNVTLVQGSSINSVPADRTAGSAVDAWEYVPQLIYVRDYSAAADDAIPTLCRKRLTTNAGTLAVGATECLVEGIEDLQIEFGIDTDNPPDYTPNFYDDAPTAAELSQAVTARIYVLSRSINTVASYDNKKTYVLGNRSVTKNESAPAYYRRVLQTTVVLRNGEAFGF